MIRNNPPPACDFNATHDVWIRHAGVMNPAEQRLVRKLGGGLRDGLIILRNF